LCARRGTASLTCIKDNPAAIGQHWHAVVCTCGKTVCSAGGWAGRMSCREEGSNMHALVWLGLAAFGLGAAYADEGSLIKLSALQTTGGKPLMQALKDRHSTREFNRRSLPEQVLSDLLWAASGVNRPESGKRTAPSARDWREIDVYVVTAEGAYLHDPDAQVLRRARTGAQDFAAADSGFMAQNVYLYCASAGLGAVVRGLVDRQALAAALGLGEHQQIIFAQTIGYPK
jgi:hypothetical protein